MDLLLILRAAIVALAISLGGSFMARALGFEIDAALLAVIGAIGGATLAAATARERQ